MQWSIPFLSSLSCCVVVFCETKSVMLWYGFVVLDRFTTSFPSNLELHFVTTVLPADTALIISVDIICILLTVKRAPSMSTVSPTSKGQSTNIRYTESKKLSENIAPKHCEDG